jgi:hypothetical protein
MQSNDAALLAISTIALHHFSAQWKPLATICLDEVTTIIFEHRRLNDLYSSNNC